MKKFYRLRIYLTNVALGVARIFSTVLVTLWVLEINSIGYHLTLSIWVGVTAGHKKTLGPTVTKKRNSLNTKNNGIKRQGIEK